MSTKEFISILYKTDNNVARLLIIGAFLFAFGQIAQARETNQPTQMPYFAADIRDNAIHNWDWQPNTMISWDIDGPDVDPGFDYHFASPSDAAGYAIAFLEWDIQPGDTIQTSDGTTTRTLVVEPLQVTGLDPAEDIVSGTAPNTAQVMVSAWGSTGEVQAMNNGLGGWSADLTSIHDIDLCSAGPASILDPDGDQTWYTWKMRCPQFTADLISNQIWGQEWLPSTQLTIEVDDASNGPGVDHTFYTVSDGNGNFGGVDTTGIYNLKAGDTVAIFGGGDSKSLLLANLAVTDIDLINDTVAGTGTSGRTVAIHINATPYMRTPTADYGGNWSADFSQSIDMQEYVGGVAYEHDDDGDTTHIWWQDYHPSIAVSPGGDWVDCHGWPINAEVDITVEWDSTVVHTQSATGSGSGNFGVGLSYDLQPGMTVTVSDGTYTESHTIMYLVINGSSAEFEQVWGQAAPGSQVEVHIYSSPGDLIATSTADSDGYWIANFSGSDLLTHDSLRASIYDAEGNSTVEDWDVQSANIRATSDREAAYASMWPPGSPLSLQVFWPADPFTLLYTDTKTADQYGQAEFRMTPFPFDLQPGMTIQVDSGPVSKSFAVTDLKITDINYATDMIYGTSSSALHVGVFVDWENGNAMRDVDVVNGAWQADFSVPGAGNNEQATRDLVYSDNIRAYQIEVENNATYYEWLWPYITASALKNNVAGFNWPSDTILALSIDRSGTEVYSTTVASSHRDVRESGTFFFDLPSGVDLLAGDVVTVSGTDAFSGAAFTKSITLTGIQITGVSDVLDTVWGSADLGTGLRVSLDNGTSIDTTADPTTGAWSVDFTGIGDVLPGSYVNAYETDADLDQSLDYREVPNPVFQAAKNYDRLEGWQWQPNTILDITIEQNAVIQTDTVKTDGNGNFYYDNGIEIHAGQTITIAGGGVTKTLLVENMEVSGSNQADNTIWGIAEYPVREVVVDVFNQPNYTAMTVYADSSSQWMADFDDIGYDLKPGDSGRAHSFDADGDASVDDWYIYNPRIQAHPDDDWVEGWEWPAGSTIHLEIDDLDTGAQPDYWVDIPVGTVQGANNPNYFNSYEVDFQYDIQVGDILTATVLPYTKVLVVTSLVTLGVDEISNTVWGTAEPGTTVQVEAHNQPQYTGLDVTAGQDGSWIADFDDIGFDLRPGQYGRAMQIDPDDDRTADDWYLPAPQFRIDPEQDTIWGYEFLPNCMLAILIDQHGTGWGAEWIGSATTDGNGEFGMGIISFDIQPGDFVMVTDGTNTKSHTVTRLQIVSVDMGNNTISGIAEPNGFLYVGIHGDPRRDMTLNADGNGDWTADLDTIGYQLVPGDRGWVEEMDPELDNTHDEWRIYNPNVQAHPDDNWLEGWDWPNGATVYLTISDNDPQTGDFNGQAVVGACWHNSDPNFFCLNELGGFDLQAGQIVTATDGVDTKVTLVTNLVTLGTDDVTDTIWGTADPGTQVEVEVHNQPQWTGMTVDVDANGNWIADLTGIHDLQMGEWGRAKQYDNDRDSTADDWRVLNPRFEAHADDDWIEGWDWPYSVPVTITIDDPGTPLIPDKVLITSGGSCPWNNDPNNFCEQQLGIDLQAGFTLTADDGSDLKTLVITQLVVQGVDEAQNTVWGTAAPGSQVDVWVHSQGQRLTAAAAGNGDWQVNFDDIGYDLQRGDSGRAAQYDTDGDGTADDWNIPNPAFAVNPKFNGVWGWEFAPDTTITISIDKANNGWGTDYTTTRQSDGGGNFHTGDIFDIEAGDTVFVTDGITSKSHQVTGLEAYEASAATDEVWGGGDPYAHLSACVDAGGKFCTETDADSNGVWKVSFAGIYDLQPGDQGWVEDLDAEGDRTNVDWWLPNPYLEARPGEENVAAFEWPYGADLTLEIDDPATPQNPDYLAHAAIQDCKYGAWHTCLDIPFGGVFDLKPGFVVTMTDNITTKTHTVTGITIEDMNLVADTVAGTAMAGAEVQVSGCIGDNGNPFAYCSFRKTTADGSGHWQVDFKLEQDGYPPFDLQGWVTAWVSEVEADLDRTGVFFEVLETRIVVYPLDDMIQAYGWPKGTELTLEVDAAANGQGVDFTNTFTSEDYYIQAGVGFNLMPGDIVTLTGAGISETTIITSLTVLGVDQGADTVFGKATAGSEVWVEICTPQGCSRRKANANGSNDWIVSFTDPGPNPEDFPVDIVSGLTGEVYQVDANNNQTRMYWDPNQTINCWPGNSISGYVYEGDGSTPIQGAYVAFEDYNQAYQRLFQAQTDITGHYGCELPDGEYRVSAEGDITIQSREYYDNEIFENATRVSVPGAPASVDFQLEIPGYFLEHLTFNWIDPMMSEPALRQAIAFGTDRQAIIDATYPASPFLDSILPPAHWAFTDVGLMKYRFNRQLAKKLLEQAGWVDQDGDSIREREDQRLHLVYICNDTSLRRKVASMFTDQMKAIGIEVEVFSDATWRQRMWDNDYQIGQFGWIDSMTLDNPQEMFGLLNTSYHEMFSNYNNPTADQIANLASLFLTRAEKLEYAHQFQRVAMADLPMLPLFLRINVPDRDGDSVPDDKDACPNNHHGGYDANGDGCLDTTTALAAMINTMRINGEISKTAATNLLKYVTSAETKLAAMNYTGAIADLNALIAYVQKNSKTGGAIQPAAGQKLIAYAQSLIRWIGDLDNLRLGALLEISNNDSFPQLVTAENEGLRLAIDQANAAGGVLGQPVLLNARDSGYQDDSMAQAAAGDLVNNLKVSAVIGPVTSQMTRAVLESVIAPAGVVEVSPSSTGPDIAGLNDNGLLFRLADSDAIRGAAAGMQACTDGHSTAAIIVQPGNIGGYLESAFTSKFTGCGGIVLRTVEHYGNAGDTLRQVLGTDPNSVPDLIFTAIYADDKQVLNLAATAPCVIGPDGLRVSQHAWSFAGKLPDDFSQQVLNGIACGANVDSNEFTGWVSVAPAFEQDFGTAAFSSAYLAAYGNNPQTFANLAYDAAALIILAAEEAHSTDRVLIQAHLPTVASAGTPVMDLATALAMVRAGTNIDWQGTYAGQVDGVSYSYNHAFQPDGETISVYLVYRLQSDGSLLLEGTVSP